MDSGKGFVIVYTGDGKGKTTAALGLCLRGYGQGQRICIIQFIKSDWDYGELKGLKQLEPQVEIQTLGAGCIGIMGDDKPVEAHKLAARNALDIARQVIISGDFNTVILDEISIAISLKLLPVEDVIKLIIAKPKKSNLVLTGRGAPKEIINIADLVTEMRGIKHPFQNGIQAKRGIDY